MTTPSHLSTAIDALGDTAADRMRRVCGLLTDDTLEEYHRTVWKMHEDPAQGSMSAALDILHEELDSRGYPSCDTCALPAGVHPTSYPCAQQG
jgi:hypothetical protein